MSGELSVLAALLWCASHIGHPAAHTANRGAPQDDLRLDHRVEIHVAADTLDAVAHSLSLQTGLRIDVAQYLRGRQLTAHVNGMQARDVLDTLAELYGWTWYVASSGRVVVARRSARIPRDPAEIASAMANLLPVDWRTYLRIGLSEKETTRAAVIPGSVQLPDTPKMPLYLRSLHFLRPQVACQTDSDKLKLWESVKAALGDGHDLPYGKLTADQQQQLMFVLTSKYLMNTDFRLLYNDPPPCVRDTTLASVALINGYMLDVGPIVVGQDGIARHAMGFGTTFDPASRK